LVGVGKKPGGWNGTVVGGGGHTPAQGDDYCGGRGNVSKRPDCWLRKKKRVRGENVRRNNRGGSNKCK